MSRTKNFDENQALEAAMYLFWSKGYANTSMQDVEKAMNLKRTSIYNAFGNKRSLFQQALMFYLDTVLSRFVTVLEQGPTAKKAVKNALNEVINLHYNPDNPGGCMVVLALLESDQHDEETNMLTDSALRQLRDAVIKTLKRGKKNGEFKNSIQYQSFANQVVAIITGTIVMAKANFSRSELEKVNAAAIQTLFS
jgi:TetR/AcrR family transcriptional repressor of nem operon